MDFSFTSAALSLGLALMRISSAFIVLPLFSQETLPAGVRNSLFVGLAALSLVLHSEVFMNQWTITNWISLALKEAAIGLALGFMAGAMLWALEAAGTIIDTKSGANQAQIMDPVSGHQSTPTAIFLSRLGVWLFVSTGGLMLLIGALLESFAIWPVAAQWPGLSTSSYSLLEAEFSRVLLVAVMVSAPVILTLFLIEVGFGMINRYAQQLNVFSIAMPIKSVAAWLIVFLIMASLVDFLIREFSTSPTMALLKLRKVLGGG